LEGEKIIADGLAADPQNKDLLFSKAYVHLFHNEQSQAEAVALVLMRTQPEWFGGYAIHQKILMDNGKFTEALTYGQKAVELSKGENPSLFLNNAVASYHSQNYAETVKNVQIALSKDATLVSGAWGVDEGIFALAKLGSRDQAFDLARRRKNADPHWREDANLVRVLKMIGEAD
jgi:tetratricopeptide (TPR) repeat protein